MNQEAISKQPISEVREIKAMVAQLHPADVKHSIDEEIAEVGKRVQKICSNQ